MSLLNDLREKKDELDARIEALRAEAKPVREQVSNIDRQLAKLQAECAEVRQKLAELTEKPAVSDHAVIRYLERKYNFTFDDVREELLTDTVIDAMRAGIPRVKMNGGTLILKGMKVVTYAP